MNVRIGNDVKVQIPVSTFGNITAADIKVATCTFKLSEDDSTISTFHQSFYTIHGSSDPVYNVNPSDYCGFAECEDPLFRGFVVSQGITVNCKISDNNIIAVFPAEELIIDGDYDCVFDIKVYEEGWDFDNLHSYRYTVSDSISMDSNSGQIGNIEIIPDQTTQVDTYIFAATDAALADLGGNYSSMIANMEGFILSQLVNNLYKLNIVGASNRIVVISKYSTLSVKYNTFEFPMNVYELDNGYYIYISKYTYSDYSLNLTIKADSTNEILGLDPHYSKGSSSFDEDDDDDEDDDNPEDDTTYVNTYSDNILKLYGTLASLLLSIEGNVSNNTITL